MKILILGPMDYPTARLDLILLNYRQDIYSVYYVLEGMIMHEMRAGRKLQNEVSVAMYLAANMTDNEYNNFDLFFGPAPKKFQFDKVICYNYNTLMAQEAEFADHYPALEDEFYTTADMTNEYPNIMEAIKHAKSETTISD